MPPFFINFVMLMACLCRAAWIYWGVCFLPKVLPLPLYTELFEADFCSCFVDFFDFDFVIRFRGDCFSGVNTNSCSSLTACGCGIAVSDLLRELAPLRWWPAVWFAFGMLREVSASLNSVSDVAVFGSIFPECTAATPVAYHMMTEPLLAWIHWSSWFPANAECPILGASWCRLDCLAVAFVSRPDERRYGAEVAWADGPTPSPCNVKEDESLPSASASSETEMTWLYALG